MLGMNEADVTLCQWATHNLYTFIRTFSTSTTQFRDWWGQSFDETFPNVLFR